MIARQILRVSDRPSLLAAIGRSRTGWIESTYIQLPCSSVAYTYLPGTKHEFDIILEIKKKNRCSSVEADMTVHPPLWLAILDSV